VAEPDLSTLLTSLGRPEAAATIAAYCARGPERVAELFAAILAGDRLGMTRDRSPRAVENDEHECLMRLAAAHPQEFVAQVRAHPAMIDRLGVLGTLASVPGADAAELLLAALRHSKGTLRWHALDGLLRRGHAAVAPRLARLLRDRDGAVRETAVQCLRRWGTTSDVEPLVAHLSQPRNYDRNATLDAIEAICTREGRPLPAQHPGPRLEVLAVRGSRIDVHVCLSALLSAGDPVARVDDHAIVAPCDGVLAAVDRQPDLVRLTFRRLTP
jgi:hypothetical protein